MNIKLKTLVRFLAKIRVSNSCWEWQGTITKKGYGQFNLKTKKKASAHRLSYEIFKGDIPIGLTIDHLCRNRRCVNPDHLECVTMTINVLRGTGPTAINKRKTHCIRGHELLGYNLIKDVGGRHCRTCHNITVRQYILKKKVPE